jgi:hypothetical protein
MNQQQATDLLYSFLSEDETANSVLVEKSNYSKCFGQNKLLIYIQVVR